MDVFPASLNFFVGFILFLIFIGFIYRLYAWIFYEPSVVEKQICSFEKNTPKSIFLEADDEIEISVIYECSSDFNTANLEVTSIFRLIREVHGDDTKFEVLCLIKPNELGSKQAVDEMAKKNSKQIKPLLVEYSGIKAFLIGGIRARGSMIFSARFIASTIDSYQKSPKPYLLLFQPSIQSSHSLFDANDYLEPVLVSKSAFVLLFRDLYCDGRGFSANILKNCMKYKVTPIIQKHDFGPREYSIFDILARKIAGFFMVLYQRKEN